MPELRPCPGNEATKSPSCGLKIYADCPTCWSTHVRLHHPKRRQRRIRQEVPNER